MHQPRTLRHFGVRVGVALATAIAAIACGASKPAARSTPKFICEKPIDCYTPCTRDRDKESCLTVFNADIREGHVRTDVEERLCGNAHLEDDEFCCSHYASITSADAKAQSVISCARLCGLPKEGPPRHCEVFEGPEGLERRRAVCTRTNGTPEFCIGLSQDEIAQIRERQKASDDAWSANRKRELEAKERQDRETAKRQSEEWARGAQRTAELHRQCELDPSRCPQRPSPPANGGPSATPTPPVVARMCTYSYYVNDPFNNTGATAGTVKLTRKTYDAPACGGGCCADWEFCCISNGREVCGRGGTSVSQNDCPVGMKKRSGSP